MISSIVWGVCFLVIACTNSALAIKIVCTIFSFLSFAVAVVCHRRLVNRVEVLEKCMKAQGNVNEAVAKFMCKSTGISEDILK